MRRVQAPRDLGSGTWSRRGATVPPTGFLALTAFDPKNQERPRSFLKDGTLIAKPKFSPGALGECTPHPGTGRHRPASHLLPPPCPQGAPCTVAHAHIIPGPRATSRRSGDPRGQRVRAEAECVLKASRQSLRLPINHRLLLADRLQLLQNLRQLERVQWGAGCRGVTARAPRAASACRPWLGWPGFRVRQARVKPLALRGAGQAMGSLDPCFFTCKLAAHGVTLCYYNGEQKAAA